MPKTTKGRVSIPRNAGDLLALAEKVYAKHTTDASASILKSMEDQNWEVTGPKIAECITLHKKAEELKAQMEQMYRQRDALLPEVDSITRDTRAFLKGVFSKSPKKLGEWGYDIDDTPQKAKVKTV